VAPRSYTQSRRAESADATRRRILDAGEELLRAVGLAGTTLTAVAKGADVARGTILHHFGSWDGLLGGLLDDILEQLVVPDERIFEGIEDRDGRIRAFVEAMVAFQERSQPWWPIFEHEMARPELRKRDAYYWEAFGRLQAAALGPELANNAAAGAAIVALSHPATAGTFVWSFERAGRTADEARRLMSDLAIEAVRRIAKAEEGIPR
jgi:AcrR family transcriptional regulator